MRVPFRFIGRTSLGQIWRPYVVVNALTRDGSEWIPIEMIVDTGADYTLLPKRYADIIGIDVNVDCRPETTVGVGGVETVHLYESLRLKVGKWESRVPMGFLERHDVPALMGRLGCIEAMRVCFGKRVVSFE